MTGTVFDIGYQPYTGGREGRGHARLAVFKDGVRAALGLGRGGRAKVLPWLFIALLAGIAFIFVLVAATSKRMGRPIPVDEIGVHYYGIASILLFLFAAMVGPDLLSRDRREGTISLYLVRPLNGSDYLLGRWAALLSVLTAAAWLPQALLFLCFALDAPAPLAYLREHWLYVPRFLAAGLALAAYATTLALLVASFTTRRAYASVFLVGLFVISTPFTIGLASEIEGTVGAWISMFNLTNIPVHVNDVIFGAPSEVTEDAPARTLGPKVLVGWYLAWTVVPAAVLWGRYRRMAP